MTTVAEVLGALESVRDPELDESLVELGFVTAVDVAGDGVAVRLRLPTYFCAPNFAFLMVDDAHAAVQSLDPTAAVRVELEDHFASSEINDAVREERGFGGAFPDETEGGLDSLRTLFQRKAFTARQGRLCEQLLASGRELRELAAMRLRDVPSGADRDRCVELRRTLGLPVGDDTPAFVLPRRGRVDAADLDRYMRIARLMRVSIEGNAGLCRSLLATRYELEEVAA
jgi:metal-sulfur cluster biosynthetic enzyme